MLIRRTCLLVIAILFQIPALASTAEPMLIAEGVAPLLPQQPQLALDEQGGIHLVYGVHNDTFYCHSSDGTAFSQPVKLPSVNVMSLGMRRGPRIAVAKGRICVTVIGGKQGKGRDGDLLAICSADGGKTWRDPVPVNDVPDVAREGLHAMAAGPNGEFSCIWLDLRNKATEVAAATSMDGGKTWGKNAVVYRSPDGNVCECCHPSLAYDAQGQLIAMWRNSLKGNRDMYAAVAPHPSAPFGKAFKLGAGTWMLDRCPMDGGALAVLQDGKLSSVWRRERTIYAAVNGEPEVKLGVGEQPVVAATSQGSAFVWLSKRGDDLIMQLPGEAATKLGGNAYDPVVAGNATDKHIRVAWEERQGGMGRIYFALVWPATE